MIDLDLAGLRGAFGAGVAGNFAGHLEQAGEAADFAAVATGPDEAPKGVFPWYVPGAPGFLGVFPLSHDRLARPRPDGGPVNLQIEPEAGVLMDVRYAADGAVEGLAPRALGAFNDCSIRRPGAPKISHKKNWGPDSKGVARRAFAVDDLDPAGPTASFRLASFLRRDGVARAYGIDSPLPGYSYYGARLLDWIADRLRHQAGDAPGSPLEPVGEYLAAAGRPATLLVGIGATRYTPLGESTYLEAGDEAVVVVYDASRCPSERVEAAVERGEEGDLPAASVLTQAVYAAG
ncbi:DUF5718 family protein [Miltoncostaea marina]|uniref:DUF5718 family protein n=1 Tax=Miltoncostaea marina TaxID=2843215 RepID=UPI001C3C951B|nr:DUF5718 family protein [Miltoncostaea marina]